MEDITLEARGWSDSRKGPQVKECKQPLEAEKVRVCFLPLNLQKEQRPADILFIIFKNIYLFICGSAGS